MRRALIVVLTAAGLIAGSMPARATTDPDRHLQVVGGQVAAPGAWPWLAALADGTVPDLFEAQFCAGSLIHPEWVLTAAHCVQELPSSLRVVIGRQDLRGNDGDDNSASAVVVHPGWDPSTTSFDLALVRLARPSFQAPVRVLGPGQQALSAPASELTVAGWGAMDPERSLFPYELLQASIPVWDDAVCRDFAALLGGTYDAGSMLCAGRPWVSPCGGDSGGPVVAADGAGPLLVGVVSYGASLCGASPSYFARVAVVSTWLASVIGQGTTTPPPPLAPAPPPPTAPLPGVVRLSGVDRYATAASVSASRFAPGVANVFLATGENFPDALAGGPAASAAGAPLLLTGPDQVPPATLTELQRLQPRAITVLGGPSAVSDAVVAQLQGAFGVVVTRVSGADRYDTAALLSAGAAPGGRVFVATGEGFPDAVAAGAAGASVGAPVLLTGRDGLAASTVDALQLLQPSTLYLVGGPGAVSPAVEDHLRSLVPDVRRAYGADRYETAAAVSAATMSAPTETVLVATGASFPDALAGGALGAGPLLLVPGSCIPRAVTTEVGRLAATSTLLLGGPSAVGAAVELGVAC